MRSIPVLLATALLAACNVNADARSQASGESVRRDIPVGAFDAVELAGAHDVDVAVGGAHSVRVEGDSGLIDVMEIKVEDGTLRIGNKKGFSGWSDDEHRVKVIVTVPSLRSAAVAGSGDLRVDRVEGEVFSGSVSGSGDLQLGALRVRKAELSVAGSGDIKAAGSAEHISASVAGSGDIEVGELHARQAEVNVAGSGNVSVHASETAQVNLVGSGDAIVAGGARCAVNKHGSGEARCG